MKCRYGVFALAILFMTAPLAATRAQPADPPPMRFTTEPPFQLAVNRIDIVERNPSSRGPARLVETWARDRLVAIGGPNRLVFTIVQARFTDTPLNTSDRTLADAATDQQSDRLDAKAEVRLDIVDASGHAVATARAIATRYQTVMESTSPAERDDIRYEMTRRLMADLSPELDRQILAHFAAYLR